MATHRQYYELIKLIPAGRVATYGDIAEMAGSRSAVSVGDALKNRPTNEEIPWWRVVAVGGRLSGSAPQNQAQRLLDEGVVLNGIDCIDLARYRWQGPTR